MRPLIALLLVFACACARADAAAAAHETWAWTRGTAPPVAFGYQAVWDGVDGGFLVRESPIPTGQAMPKDAITSFSLFLPKTKEWQRLTASGAPPARSGDMAAWDGKRKVVWFFGGSGMLQLPQPKESELWKLDLTTRSWEQVTWAGRSPPLRSSGAMLYWEKGDRLVVYGGVGTAGGLDHLRLEDLWTFDPGARTWSRSPAVAPCRSEFAAAIDEKRGLLIVHGGRDTVIAGQTVTYPAMTEAWSFDLAAKKPAWKCFSKSPAPLAGHAGAWDDTRSRMLILGGRYGDDAGSKLCADLLALDAKGGWSVPSMAIGCGPRYWPFVVRDPEDGSLFVIGGSGPSRPGSDHAQPLPSEPWIGAPEAH